MIATAAEKNPSCFRGAADSGLALWQEVVERYVGMAMAVDNRFGNTKFLLNQMVPGKSRLNGLMSRTKSYVQVCEVLKLDHLLAQAAETDVRLGLEPKPEGQKQGKKKNQAALAGRG